MKYLFVKMRRDLAKMWTQFFSVFLMALLGIYVYVGLEGAWFGMKTEMNHYFTQTNLASAWVYGNGMTQNDCREIKKIPGVQDASLGSVLPVKVKLPGTDGKEPELQVNSVTDAELSVPCTCSGEQFDPNGGGIWLDSDFAAKHGLKAGGTLKISAGGAERTLKIRGLILCPDYVYYIGSASGAMPDHQKYGYAFVGSGTMQSVLDEMVAREMQKNWVPRFSRERNSAYSKARSAADAAVDQNFKIQKQNASAQAQNRLAGVKKQAESRAEAAVDRVIRQKYNLTEAQYDALQQMIALPKITAEKETERPRTASRFVSLLKTAPDGLLSQSVNGFTLSTLKREPVDYTFLRVKMKSGANARDLEQKVQNILGPRYAGFADRDTRPSVSVPMQKVKQIQKLSLAFSFLFFLLALLTMQTSIARLIDTQRTQIGTLKALGFTDGQIRLHYTLYGLTVSFLGSVLGLILAPVTLSPAILHSQATAYSLPAWPVRLTPVSFLMVAVVVLCCTLATLAACRKGLAGMPAETMRNAAPAAGRITLLERAAGLWKRLPFGWKWTFRDISRNKIRSVMGVVGVLGCMMLLFAGFGMQYSCGTIAGFLYGKQYSYQAKATLVSNPEQSDRGELYRTAGGGQWIQESTIEYRDLPSESGALTVVGNGNDVHLEDEKGEAMPLPKREAVVTQRVAKLLNLKKGDEIFFRPVGKTKYSSVKVGGIVYVPAVQGIFISESAWKDGGNRFEPTSLLLNNTRNDEKISGLSGVREVVTRSSQYKSVESNTQSFQFIFFLLKLAAVLLAVVILYNLGILSFTEREREYATMKVLGFYQREIRSSALRENLVTTAVGWALGIPAGIWFLNVYVGTLSSSSFNVKPQLAPGGFLAVSCITVGCSVLVNLFLSRKVRKIDMVGALKSVE